MATTEDKTTPGTPDAAGNNLTAVGVPIGGLAAFAPYATANVVSDADIKVTPLKLSEAYRKLGLVKVDGAPQHSRDNDDPIELWQLGYTIPGTGKRAVDINLAENNTAVDLLTEGKAPNENGVIYVDSELPEARFIFFVATKFRNGVEERYNGVGQVTKVEIDQDTRGEVRGKAVTIEWREDDLFQGSPFKRWRGVPTVTPGK